MLTSGANVPDISLAICSTATRQPPWTARRRFEVLPADKGYSSEACRERGTEPKTPDIKRMERPAAFGAGHGK
ncbi:hypothetical protein [Actinoplanes sp. NPDC051411]|uniref:hypothetical protein n=1 Tax=Actinoplanes sp. NPDC051411 TaxID=3155522 RepID=UPI00344A1384